MCTLNRIALIRSSGASLKTGDTIEQEGKKYRVKLEEIPQYDFKPGMLCLVVWDGSEACVVRSEGTRVVYLGAYRDGYSKIAYVTRDSVLTIGYVKTSNLRPE